MKHLLNGVAIAAALVIASPVWAQNPPPASPPAPPKPSAAPVAPPKPMATPAVPAKPMAMPMAQKHRPVRHMVMRHRHMMGEGDRGHRRMMGEGDRMTDELNRQELARIQGAPPPAPALPPLSQVPPPKER